jgi:hypothetical protein
VRTLLLAPRAILYCIAPPSPLPFGYTFVSASKEDAS